MKRKIEKNQYRFTVPICDDIVIEWIKNQGNLSFSLRTVIKEYIRAYNLNDATCNIPNTKDLKGNYVNVEEKTSPKKVENVLQDNKIYNIKENENDVLDENCDKTDNITQTEDEAKENPKEYSTNEDRSAIIEEDDEKDIPVDSVDDINDLFGIPTGL